MAKSVRVIGCKESHKRPVCCYHDDVPIGRPEGERVADFGPRRHGYLCGAGEALATHPSLQLPVAAGAVELHQTSGNERVMFALQHFRIMSQHSNASHQRDVLRDHSVNRRAKVQTMSFFLRRKIRGKWVSFIILEFLWMGFLHVRIIISNGDHNKLVQIAVQT